MHGPSPHLKFFGGTVPPVHPQVSAPESNDPLLTIFGLHICVGWTAHFDLWTAQIGWTACTLKICSASRRRRCPLVRCHFFLTKDRTFSSFHFKQRMSNREVRRY